MVTDNILKSNPTLIGWAAGIIDGEGCFYAKLSSNKKAVALRFALQSCSKPMQNKFSEILSLLGVKHSNYNSSIKKNSKHRASYHLNIQTKSGLLKFSRLFKDLLIVKYEENKLVLEFLERTILNKHYIYTKEDMKIIEQLKILKKIS